MINPSVDFRRPIIRRLVHAPALAALIGFGLAGCAASASGGGHIEAYPPAMAAVTPAICGPAGASVVTDTGIDIGYQGAVPGHEDLCRVSVNGLRGAYYFGIWKTDWPGASEAERALRKVIFGPPGTTVRFDTIGGPDYPYFKFHETIRNEGFERLHVAGRDYDTMKIAHERQGFGGNMYHSIVTQWRDIRTGVTVYVNYTHISGWPQPRAWSPSRIRMSGEPSAK